MAHDGDPDTAQGDSEAETPEGESFPREYVEKIRKESRGYRDRAKTAESQRDELTTRADTAEGERDELAARLHTELVRATGILTDPTDLVFNAEHLADADKLAAAVNELIASKPHLKARKVSGDAGQGVKGGQPAEFNLLDRLKGNA
ncbi:DUF4337 domain-containing protein [Mycobacterium sp. CBMA247]|nr:DUF4337 domain-containing protein [Mycolicibacterium sp. CBMA 329]MUL91192.1 DUF4337 domain-containing protein [Mycolicibacterium sp. CBMA 331]MUL98139.1 DUF4337 domain-containing protein [Mycolicibacterium sp. CBMA 334]MUM25761.1 DUF4337 domain-containing protein [Mycolicibacterium sp. CBMA 295]MUM40951.1 DUF4337 domain-containing protein [Mycolicibacterium sp. CBMA 247]MUM47147.1 DUF4337 domain-containing protein [Mycolicibacterium sp. CBMA 294]